MSDTPPDVHLETKYVFIDTESFRREKLDWKGKRLSKLLGLATEGHLTLLTTNITKREIKAQIRELLQQAEKAINRNRVVLEQLGHAEVAAVVTDASAAGKLEAAFDKFLVDAKAIEVPVIVTVEELFNDYFAHRPPFSERKKSEFPDAAVVASLRKWCEKRGDKAYVVSGDPDLKTCCAEGGRLISCDSIGDLLTKAIVSKEFYNALFAAITANEYVSDRLAELVQEEEIDAVRLADLSHDTTVSGKIERIDGISVFSVEITDRDGQRLICEVGFVAEIVLELDIEIEGWYDHHDYQPSYYYSQHQTIHRDFYSEMVVLKFDPNDPGVIEFESIYVPSRPIELSSDEIPMPRDW